MSEIGQRLTMGQYGPALRGGALHARRSSLWRQLALAAGAFTLVVAVVAAGTVGSLLWYGERAVQRVEVSGLTSDADRDGARGNGEPAAPRGDGDQGGAVDSALEAEEITDVLNVLLVGSDSRAGLTDEQLLRLGTEAHEGVRTDSIMLLQLNPLRDQAALLSFPRDLLVERCDGSSGRINAAYAIGEENGIGGGSCLVQTVSDFTGIPIDHYVKVDFAGFIEVVDALGGVTMYLDAPLRDRHAGLDLREGCVTMTGHEALGFVRARRLDSDFGRMARQQRFLVELVREITSAGMLLNPPKVLALIRAAGQAVETDQELSLGDMRRIAFSFRDLGPEGLDLRTVPATERTIGGAYYVVARDEPAEELFRAFRQATAAPEELGTEPPAAVTVEDVPPLMVLNGAGAAGLAVETRTLLEEQGFEVARADNADRFDFVTTEVRHPPEQREEAQLVAAVFPGSRLVSDRDVERLTVVVGGDFDPQAAPTPVPTAPPATSPPASPSPDLPEPEPAPTYAGAALSDVEC